MTKINWNKELVNRINDELARGKNFPQIAKMLRKETRISFNKDDVLFRTALQSTKNVKHYSITGNHDRDSGYLLNLLLEAQYPQIEHHVGDYRQALKVGDTGIMLMHGDLATRNAPLLFAQEYRDIWNSTKHHQIISGHFHYDKTTEVMGVELIQVGTNKPNDPYETANGYVGNNKQLTAITYNTSRMTQRNYL